MFSKISFARMHTEISGLQVKVLRSSDAPASSKWNPLYLKLKEMNGILEVSNE